MFEYIRLDLLKKFNRYRETFLNSKMRALNASQVLVMIPTWHTIWGMVVCFKTLANQTILDLSYRMGDLAYQYGVGEPKKRKRRRALPLYGTIRKMTLDPRLLSRWLEYESYDYRPFFTWYITLVQILLCAYYLNLYGIGTDFGSLHTGIVERSGDVYAPSFSTVHIVTWEQNNYWIGPSFASLVHMGAKYTPCMRQDKQIYARIIEERKQESETGCCIWKDVCYQTSECPKVYDLFMKFANSTPDRPIRAVCGQDPRYCKKPRSIEPFEWSGDISQWPICNEKSSFIPSMATHMHCEIVGRPCCIQMHGQCRITTKQYCDFVNGYYHENATLCSQNYPDQLYRLFLPLFLHAGIIRILITIFLQFTIMRKFENMIGWVRLSIIYIFSGIGGYLASATFEPYMPELGPAGSQGGVLAALIVDIIYNWKYIKDPIRVLSIHIIIAIFLLFTGFLPFIDNWAQIFGFIFGSLWAAVLIPYIGESRIRRFFIVGICAGFLILLYVTLLILFFGGFEINPKFAFLNCPFPGKVCDHQGSQLKSWLPI
uniref:Peptidase S54 rhomboid domain-containing protein n=1 Tax=Acrobeloides nanus TaxID=290746 RepID=A0A914D7E7_9BILA